MCRVAHFALEVARGSWGACQRLVRAFARSADGALLHSLMVTSLAKIDSPFRHVGGMIQVGGALLLRNLRAEAWSFLWLL